MSTKPLPEPIIFTFPESVFGRRLERYLNLRRIAFTTILVPPRIPRPILSDGLSILHRRIPIVALGRDIYIDTRLILRKLEELFPDSPEHPTLGAKDGFGRGFEDLIEGWVIDAGPFWRASGTIPPQAPLMRDEEWVEDRRKGSGGTFTREALVQGRPWCLSQLRIHFSIVESMLADSRRWILGNGDLPGLADIHACWVFDWAINMAGDMFVAETEQDEAVGDARRVLNEKEFPKTHAWVRRFRKTCDDAAAGNTFTRLDGQHAEAGIVKQIKKADLFEEELLPFDDSDALSLRRGQIVSIAPADFGFTHEDKGELVGLSVREAVIYVNSGEKKLRLHFSRVNFKIQSRE